MDKQALLNELSAKFHKLGRVALVELSAVDQVIRDGEGVKWYIAGVYEQADDRLIRKNIPFYVEEEGEAGETAFYAERLPIDTLPLPVVTTFYELIETEIDTKIASGMIVKGVIDSVNEDQEFAFVTVYQLIIGEIVVKKFFCYKDTSSVLQFTPFKVV